MPVEKMLLEVKRVSEVAQGNEARCIVPEFEDPAIGLELLKPLMLIARYAGSKSMMVCTLHHIIGIDLQEAKVIDDFENCFRPFAKLAMFGEPGSVDDDFSGFFRGQGMQLHDFQN